MTEVEYKLDNKTLNVGYDSLGVTKITRKCLESLIEKQIPKKPADFYMAIDTGYITSWVCPNCGEHHRSSCFSCKEDYCSECGQRIDWSDANE